MGVTISFLLLDSNFSAIRLYVITYSMYMHINCIQSCCNTEIKIRYLRLRGYMNDLFREMDDIKIHAFTLLEQSQISNLKQNIAALRKPAIQRHLEVLISTNMTGSPSKVIDGN